MKNTDDRAESQALAQIESIVEMVARLDGDDPEAAQQEISEDPLSVQVRGPWHNVGETHGPEEFCILLCTGGPAVRIIGDLTAHLEPDSPRVEYQDWGTPWTEYRMTAEQAEAVTKYCQQFYYGE